MRYLILSLLFFFSASSTFADSQSTIDSLKALYNKARTEEQKLDLNYRIAEEYIEVALDSSYLYAQTARKASVKLGDGKNEFYSLLLLARYHRMKSESQESDGAIREAMKLAEKLKSQEYLAIGHFNLATNCQWRLDFDSALGYFEKAVKINTDLKNEKELAVNYNGMAMVYSSKDDNDKALELYFKALRANERAGNNDGMATVYYNISNIHRKKGNFDLAWNFLNKAIELNTKLGNSINLAGNYINAGVIFKEQKLYKEAESYLLKALDLYEKNDMVYYVAMATLNLGNVFEAREEFKKAGEAFEKSLEICLKNGIREGILFNYINLGGVYKHAGKFQKSISSYDSAFQWAGRLDLNQHKTNIFSGYYETYKKMGDYKNALVFLEMFKDLNDSLDLKAEARNIQELQTQYESELKDEHNKMLQVENSLKEKIINRQRIINYIVGLLISVSMLFIIFLYRNRKQLQVSNQQLSLKNQEIKIQAEKLEKMNADKDKFFSIIAHDLRNPFQAIMAITGLIEKEVDKSDNPKLKAYLKMLDTSAEKFSRLLQNLLFWANSQRELLKVSRTKLNLTEIVSEEFGHVTNHAGLNQINLVNSVGPDVIVYADKNMLNTILRNLISNSLKFTGVGGSVEVYQTADAEGISICVKDTGEGMSEKELEQAFALDKDNRYRKKNSSSGLGLLLCRDFTEAHGGKIQIKSEPGKGTEVWFSLPGNKESLN